MRVLLAALGRMRPRAADWLAANDAQFELVAWTYLFHGAHRDISVDLPGIERLLVQTEARPEDVRELDSWTRRVAALDASRRRRVAVPRPAARARRGRGGSCTRRRAT